MNPVGSYLFGCTFFATLYKEDPRGLPTASYGAIPSDVVQQIQQSAWNAVLAHPLSGVKTTLEIIAHDTLPPACERVRYSTGFGATRGSTTFRISSGSLPPGLALDGATGMITGKPTATGSYTFTLSADDQDAGTPSATLTRTITVAAAPAPEIATTFLDSAIAGCTYNMALLSRYGADTVRWSTAEALPPGLSVRDTLGTVLQYPATGALLGIPTQAGTYSVTLRAADSHGRTAARQLSLRVLPRPLNGLDYEWYHSDTLHSAASYLNLQPDKIGIHNRLWPTCRETAFDYAIRMHAWLRITTPGVYTFSVASDFVSTIDVAGRHISTRVHDVCMWSSGSDTITLQPGYYLFVYTWYNRGGGTISTSWSGPGISPGEIPLSSLFLDSAGVVPTTGASGAFASAHLPSSRARVFDLTGRYIGTSARRLAGYGAPAGAAGVFVYQPAQGAAVRTAVAAR